MVARTWLLAGMACWVTFGGGSGGSGGGEAWHDVVQVATTHRRRILPRQR